MIKILFLRNLKALYPEIDAYINYFNNKDKFSAFDSLKLGEDYDLKEFDVIWEIKGIGGVKLQNKVLVHDYASLSLPPFPKIKNKLKGIINPTPSLRVFLNETVKSGFNFINETPYCFRDMGIDEKFINIAKQDKEYEFVYVGAISKKRKIDKFLRNYESSKFGKIILIGPVDDEIYNSFKNNKDITFTGRVDYKEVPSIASKGMYGLNLIPNSYPYNLQTSTKILEYLALGLKIITTDYSWVRGFEEKHDCSFYKVDYDTPIDLKKLQGFDFKSNFKAESFLWDSVIKKSGIEDEILKLTNLV